MAKNINIAYSAFGAKKLVELRNQLLKRPSKQKVHKIVNELYDVGFTDGEDCTLHD